MDGEGVGIDVEEAILEVSYLFYFSARANGRQMMMMRLMVLWSTTPFTVGDRYVHLAHSPLYRYRIPLATLGALGLNKSFFSSNTRYNCQRLIVSVERSFQRGLMFSKIIDKGELM
jgi:hypothetical protein